jgi:hypothetical protein
MKTRKAYQEKMEVNCKGGLLKLKNSDTKLLNREVQSYGTIY